jgi:eukaryotic-like serine/threonine-protein kinase
LSATVPQIGRYRLERELGRGGMAVVYRGVDEELGRTVAVKLLSDHLADDKEIRTRFLREARIAAALNHPNVVDVYDLGERDGLPFIVMELVEGETLAGLLAREGRLEPRRAVELALQACAGLEHAHRAGMVHRDVKPGNLLLRRDGTVKIADFGIARLADSATRLTQVGTILGTAAYLAPEQADGGKVSAATDVYGLGAVLYEALSGRPPYGADSLPELLARQRRGDLEPLEGAPQELEAAVFRALALDPADRPPSAGAFARQLAGSAAELPTRRLEPPTRRLPGRPGTRVGRRVLAALVVAALLLIALGVALALTREGGSSPKPVPPPRATGAPAADAHALAGWLLAQARS